MFRIINIVICGIFASFLMCSCGSSGIEVVGAETVGMKKLSRKDARSFGKNANSRDSQLESMIESRVNSSRMALGKQRLKNYPAMVKLARKHSTRLMQNYARTGVPRISHTGFSSRFNKMALKFNFAKAAENVAFLPKNAGGAQRIVNMWINSPTHSKNLYGKWNFNAVGVAIAPDGMIFATQIFSLKTDYTFD